MATCTSATEPVPLHARRARVWLHLAEKFSWGPKELNAVADHLIVAMYDVLWPTPAETKPVDKPATTTTTYPNATVTLTTTTHPYTAPFGRTMPTPFTYTWVS